MRIVYYQQDKTFIERTTSYNQTITFTIPNNCCFIKLSGNKNNTNEQLEKSSTKTNYEPYQSQELPITLGNIELCNIGNYADKIYKENGRWYLKKYIKKLVLDGTQNIILDTTKTITQVFKYENISDVIGNVSGTYCNQLVNTGTGDIEKYAITNSLYIALKKTTASTVAEFNTYSSENNFIFYLLLKNPTTTEITDTTLINQLEAILAMKTYKNTTNIVTSGADLPPIADVVYKVGLQSMYDKINNLESRITLLE